MQLCWSCAKRVAWSRRRQQSAWSFNHSRSPSLERASPVVSVLHTLLLLTMNSEPKTGLGWEHLAPCWSAPGHGCTRTHTGTGNGCQKRQAEPGDSQVRP